jgi:adenylate kinase family enzyme
MAVQENDEKSNPMQRICIVGTTGQGKSTLARQLAAKFQMECVELDAINWQPNWTPISPSEFQVRVAEAVRPERWVIEGGYSPVRPLIWARADTVIWLDYPLPFVFWRLLRRTIRRMMKNEVLWNGNRESFVTLFSTDSIIVWLFRTYWRRKKQYPELFTLPEYRHLNVLRFQSPKETSAWLNSIAELDVVR